MVVPSRLRAIPRECTYSGGRGRGTIKSAGMLNGHRSVKLSILSVEHQAHGYAPVRARARVRVRARVRATRGWRDNSFPNAALERCYSDDSSECGCAPRLSRGGWETWHRSRRRGGPIFNRVNRNGRDTAALFKDNRWLSLFSDL